MAFSDAQEITLRTILGISQTMLDDHFSTFPYTSAEQTAVETELTRWSAASTNFTKVHPREKNFGAEINPGDEKNDIRRNIATILNFDLNAIPALGGSRLVRA